MRGLTRLLSLLILISTSASLAEKPHIEISNPPPRESCNMSLTAWVWDFLVDDGSFTTSTCDVQGQSCWEYLTGHGWDTVIIDIDYPNNAGDALVSPAWTVGPDNYLMEVEHKYYTEVGYDGGNVKINGELIEPVGGYPGFISDEVDYYAWCVDAEAGFTGLADWGTDCFDLSPWWGQSIIVSLEFGSDESVVAHGWDIRKISVGAGDPQTIVVLPDGTGDFVTIQAAIDAAIPGDTIVLGDGMFIGDGNRDLDFKGKAITVRSASGNPDLCTINCEGYYNDAHFGFVFHSGEGPDSVLEGVSIIQGFFTSLDADIYCQAHAAGITFNGASPTIRHCVISYCTTLLAMPAGAVCASTGAKAAGIAVNDASPVFTDCRITANTLTVEEVPSDGTAGWANPLAAGIACLKGKPTFLNCTIGQNTVEMLEASAPDEDTQVPEAVIAGGLAVLGGVQGEILTTDYCTLEGNSVIVNLAETPDSDITLLSIAGGMALVNFADSGEVVSTPGTMFIDNSVTVESLAGYANELLVGGGKSWSGDGMWLFDPGFLGNWVDLPSGLSCPFTAAGAIACQGSAVAVVMGNFSGNWVSATPITLPDPPAPNSIAGAIAGIESFLETEYCNFSNNQVSATPITLPDPPAPLAAAGAVFLQRSGAGLIGCTFEENLFEMGQNLVSVSMDTLFCAGGVVLLGTESMATSCEFYANRCSVGEVGGPNLDFNFAATSGGLLQSSGEILLTESHFYENSVEVFGGGGHLIAGGAVTDPITYTRGVDCLFGDNSAGVTGEFDDVILGGGGSFGEQSEPDLESCHWWNNHANLQGANAANQVTVAGALASRADLPMITQCRFYKNSGTLGVPAWASLAGAVACQNGTPEIMGCIMESNNAASTVDLAANSAVAGGLAMLDCVAILSESTLAFNRATRPMMVAAGGVDCREFSILLVDNTIIAFSENGSAVAADGGGFVEVICSNIYGNMGGDWVGSIAGQNGSGGNMSEDPLFCGDLNPEATLTLASDSPCAEDANPACGQIGALGVGCVVSGVEDEPALPKVVKLHRGYPNPFNPQVTIKFDLPKTQMVALSVFTLAGEKVVTLVHEIRPAGHHDAVWNGRDFRGRAVSSGTYLVRLETKSGVERKKLMLVR